MQNFEVDKEIFEEFISDASEQLYRLDNIISHLNVENIDMQALNEFMRVMHSLKGNSGFVGLMNLSQLAHKLEDLVVDIQNNRIYVNEEIIDIVFTGLGSCRDIIERASLILEQNQLLDKEQELIERIKKLKDKPQSVNSKQLEGELEKTLNYIRELDKNNVVIVEEELKDLMIKVQTINSFLNKYTEQKIEIAEQRQNIEQAKRYYLGFTDITASLKEMFELIEKAKQDGGGDDIYYAVELIFTKFKQIIETENVYKDKEELMLIIDMIFNEMKLLKSEFSELVCTFIEEFDAQIVKFLKYPLVIDESETVYIDKYFQKVKEGSIEYAKIKELMAIEKEVLAQLEQEETVKKTEPSKKSEIQETVKEEQKKVEDRFIRVAQDRVDNFMMNVGTLIIKSDSLHYFYKVLNNNKILEKKEIQNYRDTIIELTDMIYKLQNDLLEIRKLPLSNLFNKFPRLVMETAKKLNKQVEFKTIGETERVDTYILNELEPVLTHIIRNSLDHGLETIDERKKNNKAEKGLIKITARTTATELQLLIEDDGRGIDAEKIKKIALKKNLISETEAKSYTKEQLVNLIFLPGFSSAEKVSDVSGRGVGMDVVLTTLKKLNGSYKINTEVDKGTSIELTIPQVTTLVTSNAIIVKADKFLMAFRSANVENTIKIRYNECYNYKNVKIVKYNQTVIPVIYLNELLKLNKFEDMHKIDDEIRIVVYKNEGKYCGIIVDEVVNFQTIVVKDFEHPLMISIPGVTGYTLTGKGDIILMFFNEKIKTNF